MRVKLLSVVAGLSIFFAGCGKEEKDTGEILEKGGPQGQDSTRDPEAGVSPGGNLGGGNNLPGHEGVGDGEPSSGGTGSLQGFVGTWISPCFLDKSGQSTSLDYYQFDEVGKVIQVVLFFKSKNCQDNSLLFAVAPMGNYYLGEAADGLVPMDIHVKKQVVVLYDPAIVEEFNSRNYYGFSDWAVGEQHDVMGRSDPEGNVVAQNIFYNNIQQQEDRLLMSQFSTDMSQRKKELMTKIPYAKRKSSLVNDHRLQVIRALEKIRAL